MFVLRRSEGFARQQRFIDSEVPRAQDAGIGRDAAARLQQQYIARHKACDVDRFPHAAPKHGGVGRYKVANGGQRPRSEEHTSELQSLMRISYAVFCLKKKKP